MLTDIIADAELDKRFPPQIVAEMREIQNAPVVPSAGLLQRCHFCGSVTHGGSEVRGPVASDGQFQTKFKGVCCGG